MFIEHLKQAVDIERKPGRRDRSPETSDQVVVTPAAADTVADAVGEDIEYDAVVVIEAT